MTLVIYIPCTAGAVLISDRLNTLESGHKIQQDKIVKISNDTVIGFSGSTEACLNIIDEISTQNRDLGQFEINNIIFDTYHKLRSRSPISVEFIIIQIIKGRIKLWKNTEGTSYTLDVKQNHAVGKYASIIPHLEIKWQDLDYEYAIRFGVDLIEWASRIEPEVGSPRQHGCNLCIINDQIKTHTNFFEPDLRRLLYRFDVEQNTSILPTLSGQVIRIGYISSTTAGLETATPFIKKIIEPDLNKYASKLGYDIKFEFIIDDAQGQAIKHLEIVQKYKSGGINIFIGGGWSSQASASLDYCNNNDMLMLSTSSTSPLLAIPNDNLFRICPDDTIQALPISRVLESMGKKYIIVLQRGDAWADGIYKFFEPAYVNNGGVILERIRYPSEATDFTYYLRKAEDVMANAVKQFGEDKCAVEIISFAEFVTMITQVEDFPTINNLNWFGSDGTSLTREALDKAPDQSTHLKVFSTLAAPAVSLKFTTLYDKYFELMNQPFGYYSACTYDAAFMIMQSIIETQSTRSSEIKRILPQIAYNHFGASGWCRLNEAGDRYNSNYQIWGYGNYNEKPSNVVYGLYDAVTNSVTWNTELLGFIPKPR